MGGAGKDVLDHCPVGMNLVQLKTALSNLDSQLLGEKRVSYSQNFELPLYEICKASSKLSIEYLFASFGCMV